MSPCKVLVLAGEASGEMHAAALVNGIKQVAPQVSFVGIGGDAMAKAGVELLGRCDEISVVGGVEGLGNLPAVLRTYRQVKGLLSTGDVDLFVPVDYPGMNLRLACQASRHGVPVCYYISPQVWAWRRGRVKTIARCVDRMLVILPFEEPLYRQAGVDAHYVGHPLLNRVRPRVQRRAFRNSLGIPEDAVLFTLMPGSRSKEVAYNLPVMLGAAGLVSSEIPGAVFALALAPTLSLAEVGPMLSGPGIPPVKVVRDDTYSLVNASDAAMVASGTATLEVALLGVPMVVVYRVHTSTYEVARRLVRVRWLSLVNNVLQEEAVPELIQDKATPKALARRVIQVLGEREKSKGLAHRLRQVLSPPEGGKRAADLVLEMLQGRCG